MTKTWSPNALGRVFVFMVLLDLLSGVPLESVVETSKSDFVSKFSSKTSDDKNLRVISVMVGKIFTKTSTEVCDSLSKELLDIIKPKKLSSFSKSDIIGRLTTTMVVDGKKISPINKDAGNWETDQSINVLEQTEDNIKTRFVNSNWSVLGFKIPTGVNSGRLDIYGEYTGGTGGNPGVRVYSGPALEWRKKGYQGLTSNGGRGDGFGAPTPLVGTCKVNLNSFRTSQSLLIVSFQKKGDTYEVLAKFEGWSKFHPIHHTLGDKILIASKGFTLDVTLASVTYEGSSETEETATIGGTTLASLTSGCSLAAELDKL